MDKNDLIESIVKEVKRVLAERGISVEASPQSVPSQVSVSPVKQSQTAPSGLPQPAESVFVISVRGKYLRQLKVDCMDKLPCVCRL